MINHNGFQYAEKYFDDIYEYRHVHVPKSKEHVLAKYEDRCLEEEEWRNLGIAQSEGWVNYMKHKPEPLILLFRRPKNYAELKMRQQQEEAERMNTQNIQKMQGKKMAMKWTEKIVQVKEKFVSCDQ